MRQLPEDWSWIQYVQDNQRAETGSEYIIWWGGHKKQSVNGSYSGEHFNQKLKQKKIKLVLA